MTRLLHRVAATTVLLLSACAASPRSAPAVRADVSMRLEGDVPLRGNLVLYWLRPEEVQRDASSPSGYRLTSFRSVNALLERVVTFPDHELGGEARAVQVTLDAPADALVFALFDVHHRTFDALLDDSREGDAVALGTPAAGRTHLVLRRIGPRPPRKETCSGDRDRLEVLDAPEVAGTIGNPTRRRICVHLPRDYDKDPARRYPVVYVLPGFSGVDSGGSIGMVFAAGDEITPERAAIFVGVNLQTRAGASYLADSPLTGDFEHFLGETVPAFVDGKYRTNARSTSRALIGQSTGGFGAVSFALRHPDRFGVVAVSAPDGLDLGSWILTPDRQRLIPFAQNLLRLEDAVGPPGQMASYAADWSPDPSARWGVGWPADPKTGVLLPNVLSKWLRHSPSEIVKDPTILAGARERLSGKVYLAVGTADDFGLFEPTRRFSEQLTALGIANQFAPDDGDHGGTMDRKRGMVKFVTATLARDSQAVDK